MTTVDGKPAVLFLCTHNAGRSQMALGFFTHFAGDNAIAYSAGSEPADHLNPVAVTVMAERGIDITGEQPKQWDTDTVARCDVVVTMGCGDTCPYFPGIEYQDWPLDDPAGLSPNLVRPIRDQIEQRVRILLIQLRITK